MSDDEPATRNTRRRFRVRTITPGTYATQRASRPARRRPAPPAHTSHEDLVLRALRAHPATLASDLRVADLNARQVGIYLGRLAARNLATKTRDGNRHRWTAT